MVSEFTALNKASHLSKREYLDMIVIVYRTESGDFQYGLESEYTGDESKITERYLNGRIVPA
jgi:hypothetical protein